MFEGKHFEHMPIRELEELGIMESLERAGKRDISSSEREMSEFEDEEIVYPEWTLLKPKIATLRNLFAISENESRET
ncbi:MAG: hypothetical protein AAB590_01570 [Patescibacteria group bacterium]